MSKRQTLMLLGVIVICLLFMGFPAYIDKTIAILSGLTIIFIALKLQPEPVRQKKVPYIDHKSDIQNSSTTENTATTNIINPDEKMTS